VDLPAQPAEIVPATGTNVERRVLQAASKRGGTTKRGPYISTTRVQEIRKKIGEFNLHAMQGMKVKARRKLLAVAASSVKTRRREVEEAVGFSISEKEYTNIRLHALHPGPMKEAKKIVIRRRKVKDGLITALLHSLESGGKLQRNAFGTKVIEIVGGLEHVTTENIERSQKVSEIAAQFLCELFNEAEAVANGTLVIPENRCKRSERDSRRQCLCEAGHDRACKFTAPGSMSMTRAKDFVKLLTGPDIKKLSGLDDIKVEKGRENFQSIRKYIDVLYAPDEAHAMKKRVDAVENFHKTDFDKHLSREAEYACACLTCGFHDRGKFKSFLIKTLLYLSSYSPFVFSSTRPSRRHRL
jgi:hypothetical protein